MKIENVILPDGIEFACKNCGICCRMQPPDVSPTEQKRIAAKGVKDFVEPIDETGIRWIKRKDDDSCWFLKSNNECAIYDVRPAVCRLEPFTIIDYDYDHGRIELELNFPFSSCCPGTCEGVTKMSAEDLHEIAKAAQILVQKVLALTACDLGLPVTDKRVYSETRSRFLRRTVERADLQV
jgi:Fe-S-cluster containining protein